MRARVRAPQIAAAPAHVTRYDCVVIYVISLRRDIRDIRRDIRRRDIHDTHPHGSVMGAYVATGGCVALAFIVHLAQASAGNLLSCVQ